MRPVTLLASRSSIRMQDPLKQGLKHEAGHITRE